METAQIDTTLAPPVRPAHLVRTQNNPIDTALPEGMRRAMFPLEEGDVTLTFPPNLAGESLEDLGAYLEIFLKKEIKKSKAVDPSS